MEKFPLASELMEPVASFLIEDVRYSLYRVKGRVTGYDYSLYQDGELNPINTAMTIDEVIVLLRQYLNPDERGPRIVRPGLRPISPKLLIHGHWYGLYIVDRKSDQPAVYPESPYIFYRDNGSITDKPLEIFIDDTEVFRLISKLLGESG